ncbi:MAG: glycogen/starch synthase [Candidatus Izimaplasma sp.]|nr:glycogen/starch synthase [Candidatus Izimaplasma bacterium]
MNSNLFVIVDATFKDNLEQLTLHRMPGALPFAGKYRLIDFTLSNIKNSQITNVAIFPYGNYRSLQDHVGSGKKWDLDRRRDGLFILPPKNLYIAPDEMITFQRMYEHIEFFKRSSQDYAVVTSANIVWNIDFYECLDYHLKNDADITEVMYKNIRLKTFIISKKLLIEYIMTYATLEYRTMSELVEKTPNLKVVIYKHQNYTRTITDTFNYLKSNLDMLRFDIGSSIFTPDRPIYSKEKTSPPARYLKNAVIENSMISSGCIVDGTVINSVIARDVTIKEGAIVKNSFIMSNSIIEEKSELNYTILDKQTIVKNNTHIEGTLKHPYVTQKEQLVSSFEDLRVLLVASESYPFIKTGGLADVIGSLSRNLGRQGVDTTVILPLYKKIRDTFFESLKYEFSKTVVYNEIKHKIRVHRYQYKKAKYYFIDNFAFFNYEEVYGYENDADRFAFFNKAVVEMLDDLKPFDLVHVNDWHTALIPILIDNSPHKGLKTLLTIHNIDYQGIANSNVIKKLGITNFVFKSDKINFLEIGINTATKLSTVSPTYKEELKYEYYGKNLTYSLLNREREFYGILNGISSSFNPTEDKAIKTNYSIENFENKIDNKLYLQEKMGLDVDKNKFIIGMVTRIVEQKGFDLILNSFDELLSNNKEIQFVLLGAGDKKYISELEKLAQRHPEQIKLNIGYDATKPNYIYAGADVFLMPSRFEPCGLGQMISLRYGTLPIVRRTGGLNDTVFKYDHITKKGNGFTFNNYDANEMKSTIENAYDLYKTNKKDWNKLIERAMRSDNSLVKSTQKYIEFYNVIVKN